MLNRNSGDPNVVPWNGPALFAQEHVNLGIAQRRLFGNVQDANGGFAEESRQQFFVFTTPRSGSEPAVQFAQNYGG